MLVLNQAEGVGLVAVRVNREPPLEIIVIGDYGQAISVTAKIFGATNCRLTAMAALPLQNVLRAVLVVEHIEG